MINEKFIEDIISDLNAKDQEILLSKATEMHIIEYHQDKKFPVTLNDLKLKRFVIKGKNITLYLEDYNAKSLLDIFRKYRNLALNDSEYSMKGYHAKVCVSIKKDSFNAWFECKDFYWIPEAKDYIKFEIVFDDHGACGGIGEKSNLQLDELNFDRDGGLAGFSFIW